MEVARVNVFRLPATAGFGAYRECVDSFLRGVVVGDFSFWKFDCDSVSGALNPFSLMVPWTLPVLFCSFVVVVLVVVGCCCVPL